MVISIKKLLTFPFTTVLDVGAGDGKHSRILEEAGKTVTQLTYEEGDYNLLDLGQFDCIWASHVLEHQVNPNLFLKKCFNDLNENGILAVTVPPTKPLTVGGHVTLWTPGVLLYQLVRAGFDCSDASLKTYGYNISVIVKKRPFIMPRLRLDYGDLDTLAPYFPVPIKNDCFEVEEVNW